MIRVYNVLLNSGLRDAIMRRNIGTLEKAINDANKSSHQTTLESWIKKAEVEMESLTRFNRFGHAILEMKQATISEIRSYKRPPIAVERVMMATFKLLGEREEWIQVYCMLSSLIEHHRHLNSFSPITIKR